MKKIFGGIALGFLGLLGLSFGLTSCLDSGDTEDPAAQLLADVAAIDSYLESINATVIEDPSGIRMVITELGTGLPAIISNVVDVDYVGKLFTTGATFDQGNIEGPLTDFIQGWQIAFTTLPAGSKATLYIPAYWGYGNSVQGSIPANSILIFDVDFNEVVATSQELQRIASDTVAIDSYLASKSIDAIKDSTGLRYVINELGTGDIPGSWYDGLKIKFTYTLLSDDTKVVYTAEREPTTEFYSRLVDYVHGMKIAFFKLPVGSKATLYVRSGLGYGPRSASDQGVVIIPENSNMIVGIELVGIVE